MHLPLESLADNSWVSIARKFCFMQWKIKFPTRENKVSPI